MWGREKCPFSSRLSLWLALISTASVQSGPLNSAGPSREVSNNSLAEFDPFSKGCRYKGLLYNNYEEVSTDEPCLACQCKGTAVVCKLRICPEIPVPPPPGCIVVHKAKSCCSQLICHGQESAKKISREQRFPTYISNDTLLASVSNVAKDPGFCVLDGTVYAEGSAMRSSTLCQYCFCIRGEMKCSEPQCVIPLKGCEPQFRSYSCCPSNYDCGQSNETAILKTLPSSTQVPQFLKGCLVNGQFVREGEPVLPLQLAGYGANSSANANVCQTCFCMGGVVHCRPLECDKPIDGCLPIKEDGHCCPDRYDCSQSPSSSPKTTTTVTVAIDDDDEALTSVTAALLQFSGDPSTVALPTEPVIILTSNSVRQEDLPTSATTVVSPLEETGPTANTNEDSFERIASNVMTGSSEESTVLPVLIPQSRVTLNTIGGFKNRSDLLGSREERRSKDGDELTAHKHSVEDDEKEEFAYQNTLETTVSNAIEEFAATTVFDDVINDSTQDPEFDSSVEPDTTSINNLSIENVTENYLSDDEDSGTTTHQSPNYDEGSSPPPLGTAEEVKSDETVETSPIPGSVAPSFEEEPSSDSISVPSIESGWDQNISLDSASVSSAGDEVATTVPPPPSLPPSSSSTNGNLEFIPFVIEDGRVPNSSNESLYTYQDATSETSLPVKESSLEIISLTGTGPETNVPVLKPLELKYLNGSEESSGKEAETLEDALPIIVEKDVIPPTIHQFNVTSFMPVSTSLYSNGYYPHGGIIKDDGPADELTVSQGELNDSKNDQIDDEEEFGGHEPYYRGSSSPSLPNSQPDPTPTAPSFLGSLPTAIPSNSNSHLNQRENFNPSLASQPHTEITGQPLNNPSRTYSKFGMQDSPLYRFDHHAPVDGPGFAYTSNPPTTYHHRYYNEPEPDFPPSRTQPGYNYYNTYSGGGGGSSSTKEAKLPHRGSGIGMLPQLYKDNQFFYEDSSAALDSYEADYETYFQSSSGPSTPPTSSTTKASSGGAGAQSSTIQFLGERVRLPSYNQQRATSTPKYKYAYLNNNKVTLQSKPITERTTTRADLKPLAPFPFNLPRKQDNLYNLGIKLSGCNVVGKMYSVGEIIEELSSDCLRCMCSDIRVHCVELKC